MNWMILMLSVVTVCYAATGIYYFAQGSFAWGVFWSSYAVANAAYMIGSP